MVSRVKINLLPNYLFVVTLIWSSLRHYCVGLIQAKPYLSRRRHHRCPSGEIIVRIQPSKKQYYIHFENTDLCFKITYTERHTNKFCPCGSLPLQQHIHLCICSQIKHLQKLAHIFQKFKDTYMLRFEPRSHNKEGAFLTTEPPQLIQSKQVI